MAKKRPKPREEKPAHAPRSSWRGSLAFGLVTFPVEAFNALNAQGSDFHFHQIHAACHNRIHYQKVCPIHGEVANDEIVSGYEYKKDKYVELDPKELTALRPESDRALKIDAFVSPDAVDPLYFDGRMYYLMPTDSVSNEPYAVIVEAMEREHRHGIAHLIFSGKDQIALIRSLHGLLHMAMLNYDAEIRSPSKTADMIKRLKNIARQVHLAQTLINEWSQDHFDFSKYEDTYREKVKELIEAKVRGHEVVSAPVREKPAKVLNLMDALKRSVHAHSASPVTRLPRSSKSRSAPRESSQTHRRRSTA
jgi:DNA end-binding protein Ku